MDGVRLLSRVECSCFSRQTLTTPRLALSWLQVSGRAEDVLRRRKGRRGNHVREGRSERTAAPLRKRSRRGADGIAGTGFIEAAATFKAGAR